MSVDMELGRASGSRAITLTLGVLALTMAVSAIAVQILAPMIALSPESANAAGFGLLLGSVGHATAMWQWR